MENIFENVKFGDKFKTRDGRLAIFIRHDDFDMFFHLEGDRTSIRYFKDGKWLSFRDTIYDIVARWNEPIDEEKLNERSALEGAKAIQHFVNKEQSKFAFEWADLVRDAYKKGYHDAKEE